MGTLGTAVCRNCGKVFERVFGRQVFCCEKCRREKNNEARRIQRRIAGDKKITAVCDRKREASSGAKYVSIKDAALMLGVSRPTIYRKIVAGELHPVRVSSRTVRIAVEELLIDSGIERQTNTGDFSIPIRIDEALELYGISQGKFFSAVKKAGVRPKMIKGVDYFPKLNLDELFPAPPKIDRSEWYSVEELTSQTGLTGKYVRDFVRNKGISKMKVGQTILINRREWNLMRFSKGQLTEEFLTVDQAKKLYHIGQGRFYRDVNAAGIQRHRDGVFVYFRKSDLDKVFDNPKMRADDTENQ